MVTVKLLCKSAWGRLSPWQRIVIQQRSVLYLAACDSETRYP